MNEREKPNPVGMVRFMRQLDMGSGNYTQERGELLAGITMEDFKRFQEEAGKDHKG